MRSGFSMARPSHHGITLRSGPERLWATIVMCTFVGFILVGIVNLAERLLTRGRYRPVEGML